MALYPSDADTFLLWQLDEPISGYTHYDSIGTRHLQTVFKEYYTPIPWCCGTSWKSINRVWDWNSPTDAESRALLLSEFTIDVVFRYEINVLSDQTIICHGGDGESEITNRIFQLYVDTTHRLNVFFENGAGLDNVLYGPTIRPGKFYIASIRRRQDGALYAYDFFLNGICYQTSYTSVNPTGGSSGSWGVGNNKQGGSYWYGNIGGIRISDVARTDADIIATYKIVYGLTMGTSSNPMYLGITDGGMGMFGRVIKNARTTTSDITRKSVLPNSNTNGDVAVGSIGAFNTGFN